VAQLVPPGSRVAEIGTDHGILPRRLLAGGRASFCIATDLSEAAIERLRRRHEGYPRSDRIDLRAGDGLSVLGPQDRLDVLVAAGLGTPRIVRILESPRLDELGLRRLVLQPQTDPAGLRRWLRDRGIGLVDERLALERGRFYVVLAAEPGAPADPRPCPGLDEDELLEAGPWLVRSSDPLVRQFWRQRLERCERALQRGRGGPETLERVRDLAARVLDVLPRSAGERDPDRLL
jgi:tRNA (adenine22-N1)-methyltransferase